MNEAKGMGTNSSVDKFLEKLEKERRIVLSLMYDIRAILEEKGLDNPYILGKLITLSEARDNLELLAMTRFLDDQGRYMLAQRINYTLKDLNGFYTVSARFSNKA